VRLAPAGDYLRLGHRGAAALAAENSLAAIEAALAAGVDGVEVDVVADGERLRLAHSLREPTRASPSLDEALAIVARAGEAIVHLDLELRGRERDVLAVLDRHGMRGRAVASSFDVVALRALRAAAADFPIGLGYPEDRLGVTERRVPDRVVRAGLASLRSTLPVRIGRLLRRAGANAAMLHHLVLSPALMARCRALGVPVFAWTVNDAAALQRALGLGVAAVVSDDPRIFPARVGNREPIRRR
jgi:glycerophosphoryl diester phosphodiesterase